MQKRTKKRLKKRLKSLKKYLLFVLLIPFLLIQGDTTIYSSSDGSDDEVPEKFVESDVSFHQHIYARILYRDDLINPTRYFLEIKAPDNFPSIDSDNIESEMNLHALVRLRGVHAPRALQMKNRLRPHVKVERERKRFDAAMTHVWKLLSSAEYLILRNVTTDENSPDTDAMSMYRGFVADVYYVVGEVERSLKDDLMAGGYVSDAQWAIDFGDRLP